MSVNKAILVGRLGRDPEIRTTSGGTAIANIRLATSENRKDRDGNWTEHTEWHSVVAFGKTAETAGRFLTKGRQVYVEGRIQTRKWQDKEGKDRYSTEIVCNVLRFLGSKSDGEGASNGGGSRSGGYGGQSGGSYGNRGGSQSAPRNTGNGQANGAGFADDDIPF